MASKVSVFLVLCLATVLFISSQVSAEDLSETSVEPEYEGTDQGRGCRYYRYCCMRGYYGCLRWCYRCTNEETDAEAEVEPESEGTEQGRGGGWCRFRYCCRRGRYGVCIRWCCRSTNEKSDAEVIDAKPQEKPQN